MGKYIKRLQYRSEDASFLQQNDDDDITAELMSRIERNGQTQRAPREVRAARRVIQNWMQIENESQIIRHAQYQKPSSDPTKLAIDLVDLKRYREQTKEHPT